VIDTGTAGAHAHELLDALAECSDDPDRLTRLSFGPAHRRASDLILGWMEHAGLAATIDAAGTVRGSWQAVGEGRRCLLLGSHIDTVPNAGRFDGMLGVVVAILAAELVLRAGDDLPFDIEVLAFGDEEGLRYPNASIGSRALGESLSSQVLQSSDAAGVRLGDAIAAFRNQPQEPLAALRLDPDGLVGYLEVHIEQGPVLDSLGAPLGVVTAIAAATRLRIEVSGTGGHAGTVPMRLRRDALAGAADLVLAVEALGQNAPADLVATVGELEIHDAAANAIPSEVEFTVDMRAATDAELAAGLDALRWEFDERGRRRALDVRITTTYEGRSTPCDTGLTDAVAAAVTALGLAAPRIASGAGHDAQSVARVAPVAMIFVRCADGVSHDPAEYASPHDVGLAVAALVGTVERLAQAERARECAGRTLTPGGQR
jgi:allantoate deiminase